MFASPQSIFQEGTHEHQEQKQQHESQSEDESDLFADFYDEDDWAKLSNKSTDQDDTFDNNNNINNEMIMDLSVLPVGGMRRVSSCYFSICSNISSDHEQNATDRILDSPFPGSVDDNITAAGTTSDYLYHDILTNVFTYLDARSLASFSETGKRPNFECFYFLELQLQRGLLRGITMNGLKMNVEGNDDGGLCLRDDGLMFISGTGAVSRLASMDESKAREIVQTYLDSNSSIRAMPLSHSLEYLRQVLRQHGLRNMRMPQPPAVPTIDDIMPAKNARNMALFFTFFAAASYMHGAEIPDPSEVINAENAAALRDALVKMGQMGLATGVLKTMKEAAAKTSEANETSNSGAQSKPRPSSIGHLEDLSQILPDAITSRLYNAFSTSAPSLNAPLLDHQEDQKEQIHDHQDDQKEQMQDERNDTTAPLHRSKRSHLIKRDLLISATESKAENILPAISDEQYDSSRENYILDPENIVKAMKHPTSSNPYDHSPPFNNIELEVPSLFAFDANPSNLDRTSQNNENSLDSREAPSGCVGAYTRAVRNSAVTVTRLIKQRRREAFEALDVEDQMEMGLRFIDACSSDDKLPIVKDILQKQCMDVDRFFVGPDDTETCALHAAAFNGAERTLEFLSGGIDEYDMNNDAGLCDVDIRDANGWTALHFAAGANSVSSVRILAQHGAKLTIEASNGYTPYHWAERLSNEEVAQELQRLGANCRFVGGWMFGSTTSTRSTENSIPFVSFLANRFFGSNN